MTDLSAAGAALAATKTAFDLAKTILDVQGSMKVQGKVIELQQQILSAQQSALLASEAQAALLRRIQELEAEITRLKEWDAGKSEYRLLDAGSGALVYMPEAEPTPTQPNHWLCVKCFEHDRRRSVLQNQGRSRDDQQTIFGCPACRSTVMVHWRRGPHNRGQELTDGTRRPD